MTPSAALAWHRRRTRFNHDWLKNEFLPALTTFRNISKGVARGPSLGESFRREELAGWPAHMAEARELACKFTAQMSPRTMFSVFPLSSAEESTRQWLAPLVHELWLRRAGAQAIADRALESIEAADASWRRLQTALGPEESSSGSGVLEAAEDLLARCQALARSFEKFPRAMRIE